MSGNAKKFRDLVVLGDLVYIPLSDEKDPEFAIVDKEDLELVNKNVWGRHSGGYAEGRVDGEPTLLHNLIAGYKRVDHKNGDKLDNRRTNLRPGPPNLNKANQGLLSNNRSGYKGVSWNKGNRKWRAGIGIDNRIKYLGVFATAEEAALAYNEAALEAWGDYAQLNVIEGGEE